MTHLLVCAIEDPGVPHSNRHTTILGQVPLPPPPPPSPRRERDPKAMPAPPVGEIWRQFEGKKTTERELVPDF